MAVNHDIQKGQQKLMTLEFSRDRKSMSVIVKEADDKKSKKSKKTSEERTRMYVKVKLANIHCMPNHLKSN